MKPETATGVDQIGLNLLRVIIGTFFMAIALELIEGFDPAALFRPVLRTTGAEAVGAISLLCLTIWFMLGAALRLAALSLALFVLASSFLANFVAPPTENLSAFWYDLTLACGVLLSYLTLDEKRLRRASILQHHARVRRIEESRAVKPRRVAPKAVARRRNGLRRPPPVSEDDVNIFANI